MMTLKALLINAGLLEHFDIPFIFKRQVISGVLIISLKDLDFPPEMVHSLRYEEFIYIDAIEQNIRKAASLNWQTIQCSYSSIRHSRLDLSLIQSPLNQELRPKASFPDRQSAQAAIYPSLFGFFKNRVVYYDAPNRTYREQDSANAFGNMRLRSYYQSRLAKLVIEQGAAFWQPAFQKVNRYFLQDFLIRKDDFEQYPNYFSRISKALIQEKCLSHSSSSDLDQIEVALRAMLEGDFDMEKVSQFFFHFWRLDVYGAEHFEPLMFLTHALSAEPDSNQPLSESEKIQIWQIHEDLHSNPTSRERAYALAQPWGLFAQHVPKPRTPRTSADPHESKTIGILPDEDSLATTLETKPHFSAKQFYTPTSEHPVVTHFKTEGLAFIAGPSGTFSRTIYMLLPLLTSGLLTQDELMSYAMGAAAYLVYMGHHSYEEVIYMSNLILFQSKAALDPIRSPVKYYEQLLTPEFVDSDVYTRDLSKCEF